MLTRQVPRRLLGFRSLATMAQPSSTSPLQDLIRERLAVLNPTRLDIVNDSQRHSHAMERLQSPETHFRLVITAEAFRSKHQPARHRMVYSLLEDQMKDGRLYGLQLRTMTPEEEAAKKAAGQRTTTTAVPCAGRNDKK